jgi:SAM-dependent methyltransferase
MRRVVFLAGAVAVVGAAVLVGRSRGAASAGPPGVLPSSLGSWVNAYLDRPLHGAIAGLVDLQPDDDLLDVACGAGYFLTESASHVGHVAGVDLSEPKVGLARRRLADRIAAGTAEIRQGDAGALPWEDARFSAVTCTDAFPFFPDPDRALAEMCRVLRPGGRAVIDMNPMVPEGTESYRMRGPGGEFWAWNDADVQRMMEAAGLDDVAITHVPGTDSRILNDLSRRMYGTDEETVVAAVKPMPVHAELGASAAEAVAVG